MANVDVKVLINAVDNASKVLQGVGKNAQAAAKTMAAVGTVAAAGLGLSVKAAIDFESAFAGVRKTVDASEADFKRIENNFRNIAKVTPVAATELSRIGELAGQLGVSGVDNITKFTKTIADISVSTNLTTEQAATDFARLSNIMGESLDNVDRIGSAIVDLGNNFATTESEISNFAQRISGAGKIAGLTTDQVLAIGAAMSSVGVEAEAGGTSVQKVLNSMTEAVATGNEALQVFAETAGMTADEFKKAYEQDAGRAFQVFVEGLGEQGNQAFATLDELGLSNERVVRAFLSLAGAGDILGRALDTSNKAWEDNTALLTEAEKRYATTESQLKIFRNNLNDIGITIGSSLLPSINKLVEVLKPMLERFANFAEQHPTLITAILGITAGLGALAVAGLALSAAWGGIVAVGGILIAVIGALISPIGLAIAIIGGLIAIGVALHKNWDTIVQKAKDLDNSVTQSAQRMGQRVRDAFASMKQGIQDQMSQIVQSVTGAWDRISGLLGNIIGKASEAISRVREAIGIGGDVPGRQHGGAVVANRPYLVGEQGAELFVPSSGGRIVPNDQLKGGGGTTNNFNLEVGTFLGTRTELRNYALLIWEEIEKMATSQNKTPQELLGI